MRVDGAWFTKFYEDIKEAARQVDMNLIKMGKKHVNILKKK